MIGKVFAVGVALSLCLAGCANEREALFGKAVSGDADAVVVKVSYTDPGPDATRHCAKYEKSPEFEKVTGAWWRWVGGGNQYFYKCVTRRGSPPMDSARPAQ